MTPATLTPGLKILYRALTEDAPKIYTIVAISSSKAPECERNYYVTLEAEGKTCRVVMAEWARVRVVE